MQPEIEQLWQLAYKSFNRSHEAFEIPGIVGGASASKEVGHRLMDHISQLRQPDSAPTQAALEAVEGDILVAEAGSWVAHDTAEHMLDLLDKLRPAAQ